MSLTTTTGTVPVTAEPSSTADLITYGAGAVGAVLFVVIVLTFLIRLYRRATKETAFVRTGFGGGGDGRGERVQQRHETAPLSSRV